MRRTALEMATAAVAGVLSVEGQDDWTRILSAAAMPLALYAFHTEGRRALADGSKPWWRAPTA